MWIGNAPEKCLPIRTFTEFHLNKFLINLSSLMNTPSSTRILHKTSCQDQPDAEHEAYYTGRNNINKNTGKKYFFPFC